MIYNILEGTFGVTSTFIRPVRAIIHEAMEIEGERYERDDQNEIFQTFLAYAALSNMIIPVQ